MFFIREAIKLPDAVHSLKQVPFTFRQDPGRIFDLRSQTPVCMHLLVNLFSPRGIPAGYGFMQGFGVNGYMWFNEAGDPVLVKYTGSPAKA